jgi:hypothetical protein
MLNPVTVPPACTDPCGNGFLFWNQEKYPTPDAETRARVLLHPHNCEACFRACMEQLVKVADGGDA